MKKSLKSILFVLSFLIIFSCSTVSANENIYKQYYNIIYHFIETNSELNNKWIEWMTISILQLSLKYQIDPFLLTANIAVESNFNPSAISSKNAVGLSQLTQDTANMLDVDRYDPVQNLEGGAMYLRQLLDQFTYAGQWKESYAIAAYNCGPGAVIKYENIPPYEETISHVNKVANVYKILYENFRRN